MLSRPGCRFAVVFISRGDSRDHGYDGAEQQRKCDPKARIAGNLPRRVLRSPGLGLDIGLHFVDAARSFITRDVRLVRNEIDEASAVGCAELLAVNHSRIKNTSSFGLRARVEFGAR